MSNKSDFQNINTLGHTINNVPNGREETGNIKQTTTNGNIDKSEERISTWTWYCKLSRILDRLTMQLMYSLTSYIYKLSLYLAWIFHTFTDAKYYSIMFLEERGCYGYTSNTILYKLV